MRFDLALQHSFGGFDIDVTLAGGPGVTALFGPSGSGKTTIVKALAGLLRPAQGHATLGNRTLWGPGRFLPPHKRRIGAVFQDARLFPHLSVAQNVDYGSRFAPVPPNAATRADTLSLLGLEPLLSRRPATLSGGEAQRVALARALLSAPEMLLMDEPLAALDGPRKDEILPYLERLKRAHEIPILYVTHAVDEIARLADRVVLLDQGRITAQGDVFDILSDPATLPRLGLRDAGAILQATVIAHASDGLTRLDTAAGPLELPGVTAAPGDTIRLHIPASDIILATSRPEALSARNILPVTITEIIPGKGPGAALALQAGSARLIARITARSLQDMQLSAGQRCFAILKASAIARTAIGT